MGGETGPDLTKSALVRDDVDGDKLEAVIRDGRTDKGMPAFRLAAPDLAGVVAYVKSQKAKADLPGARRSVNIADLQSGNAERGRQYFNGAGRLRVMPLVDRRSRRHRHPRQRARTAAAHALPVEKPQARRRP